MIQEFRDANGPIPGDCVRATMATLLNKPLQAVPHFALFGSEWVAALLLYLKIEKLELVAMEQHQLQPGVRYMAFGPSPRGKWEHSVVWGLYGLIEDPHPEGLGLAGPPREIWWLKKKRFRG